MRRATFFLSAALLAFASSALAQGINQSGSTGGGATGANPSAVVGTAATNGSASTFMRSDAAPAIDQTMSPTMTGTWTFSGPNAYGTPASINLTNAVSCTISACVSGLGANVATALGQTLNGTGAISATTNPSFVTPALGTIASGNLTNGTGYTLTNLVGAGTAAAANTGTSGATLCLLNASCTFSGSNAYGTPASINLTNATAYPATALSGLGTGVGAALGQALNGTGALTATASPTFVTPALGTIASGVLTNATGYPAANLAGLGTGVGTALGTALNGSGALVATTSPALVTPSLGAATATTINGDTLTAGSWTLTGSAGKTLTFSNSLTLAGTDATTMTFPSTSATIARTDAAQTFTGTQTFSTIVPTTVSVASGGQYQVNGQPLTKGTAPTITSGFGTSPSITGVSTAAFAVTVGTGGTASTGVLTFGSTANHGWSCQAADITTTSAAVTTTKVTANTTTTVTVGNFTDVSASGPWNSGDTLLFNCMAY
jgi:hypothetical protein